MCKDRVIGVVLVLISILGIIIYGYFLFLTAYDILLMKLTVFIAVSGILGILAWIGYTLVAVPLPKPVEELEKEIEKELEKLETLTRL